MANAEDPRCYKNFGGERSMTTIPVKILVGLKRTFYVRENLLSEVGVFKAMLKKHLLEGQQRVISLVEVDPEIFAVYLQWLYFKGIFVKEQDQSKADEYILLAKLYALGEKLLDTNFQKKILEALIASVLEKTSEGRQFWPSHESVSIIYDATTQNSPARKLLVAMHVYAGNPDWIAKDPDASNHEFLVDLSRALLSYRHHLDTPSNTLKSFLNQIAWTHHDLAKYRTAST